MLELVRALAIAWKNLAAYPAGHPALAASMALAHQRLQELLSGSGTATLGVARDGLVCGQEKVTSSHARDLGRALYLREVALLRFEQGVTAAELEALLRSISLDAARSDAPALAGQLSAAGVTHVQVEAVDFSQIRVTDDMAAVAPAPATLWDDLLRAILAGHTLSAEGRRVVDSGAAATPGGLAAILQEAMGAGKWGAEASAPRSAERARLDDRLSQVVGKHFSGVSAERMLAANQIAELVRALPEDIRGALVASALRTLASDESAGEALKVLADSAAPDTILQALRHIKEGVPLSSHALRLLHALSSVSPSLGARQVAAPEPALLAEMSVLFLEDDVDRYNPEDHKQLLTYAALDVPNPPEEVVDAGDRMMSLTDDAVADHMANASIEMLVRLGGRPGTDVLLARLGGLFRDCVSRGRLEAAVTLAEDLKAVGDEHALAPAVQALVDEAIGRLATAESVGAILEALHRRGAHSASLARRLMDALGAAAARGFLVALAEEPDKSRRRRILELLVSLGPVIVRPAVELLGDTRWYVVRNMIILLQRVGDHSALADVRLCAAHPDLRVRLEAIKYLLAHDPDVPRDLLARAIHDRDPKMAEAAVTLAGSYGIKEAVGPLLEIVADWDFFGRRRSIRVKALKALGELADPAALPRLERFFRNWLVPLVALDERRAAYRSLHAYPAEARTTIVERGLRSRDEEIRRICLDLMRVRPVPATASGRA